MIGMGDEMARTQLGNNNAYCHDNLKFWLDWTNLTKNHEIFDLSNYVLSCAKTTLYLGILESLFIPGIQRYQIRASWPL